MSRPTRQEPYERSLKRLQRAFWRRNVARGLLRAAWLALLVPTIAAAGELWLGWQLDLRQWAVAAVLVGLGSFFWSLRPINVRRMLRRLDNGLGLRARLMTAFEVSQTSPEADYRDNVVVQRLLREAVAITIQVRRKVRLFDFGLWLEVQTLIAVLTLFAALLVLGALGVTLPSVNPMDLPVAWQEPGADEVLVPNPQLFPPPGVPLVQMPVMDAEQAQQALQALADALRDQAIARGIAEAIDRGDLSGASEGLRRLADQLGELSRDARQGLGEALEEAAENSPREAQALRDALQAGSVALENDDLDAATEALEQLAEALESLTNPPVEAAQTPAEAPDATDAQGEDPGQDSEQSQAGDGATGNSGSTGAGEGEGPDSETLSQEERLAVEGQPLELESAAGPEEGFVQPAEANARPDSEQVVDTPFSRQSTGTAAGDLGPDPLTYPWDKRDVVRRYFTP
jgi:hypothetical protein